MIANYSRLHTASDGVRRIVKFRFSYFLGNMSKEPHLVTTAALVFHNVRVVGVLMGKILQPDGNKKLRDEIFAELQASEARCFFKSANFGMHSGSR